MTNLPATTNNGELATTGHTSPALPYLASLSPSGRPTMISSLKRIAAMLGVPDWRSLSWDHLTYEHVALIRMKLMALNEDGDPQYKPATINKYLACLKGVAHEAWRNGMMDGETYARIKDTDSVTGETLLAGRAPSSGEIDLLMRACAGPDPAARRDAAIISLAFGAALPGSVQAIAPLFITLIPSAHLRVMVNSL